MLLASGVKPSLSAVTVRVICFSPGLANSVSETVKILPVKAIAQATLLGAGLCSPPVNSVVMRLISPLSKLGDCCVCSDVLSALLSGSAVSSPSAAEGVSPLSPVVSDASSLPLVLPSPVSPETLSAAENVRSNVSAFVLLSMFVTAAPSGKPVKVAAVVSPDSIVPLSKCISPSGRLTPSGRARSK